MSATQKMFATGGCLLAVVLVFTQAVPVPAPEEVNPEYRQFVSAQVVQESAGQPMLVEAVDPAVVRPVRSASPFFGVFSSYERPYKTQKHHHHHHHHHEEEYEPEYHHRPQHHKPQYHHQSGGGAGSFASAGSFAGGQGGGGGHSQSAANSQSASFGFGPFQASYSASSAHSGSHSGGRFSDY